MAAALLRSHAGQPGLLPLPLLPPRFAGVPRLCAPVPTGCPSSPPSAAVLTAIGAAFHRVTCLSVLPCGGVFSAQNATGSMGRTRGPR